MVAACIGLATSPGISQTQNTLRIGMTAADIPTSFGQPDNGFEGFRFMGLMLYDALINWDLTAVDRPSGLVPGLAESWAVDPKDDSKWIFKLRKGAKFHDGSEFNADAVIFNFDKLFDHFPRLRIASVENGSEFLPDLFRKLRSNHRRMPGYFKEDPIETFRRHVWINPFWEDDVNEVVEQMGAEHVIFGSDWPHIEGMPKPLDYVDELAAFDDEARLRILRENTVGLNELQPA